METEFILKLVFFGLAHWLLVPFALESLIARDRVLGGHKAPWAVAILFLTCFGSLLYLMLHPQPTNQRSYQLASRTSQRRGL
jgi:hypothetical protein